jgi:hypothetical protein
MNFEVEKISRLAFAGFGSKGSFSEAGNGATRVARFFLVCDTKTRKNIHNK